MIVAYDVAARIAACLTKPAKQSELFDAVCDSLGASRLPVSEAEREGLPPAARALADRGERLALSLLDVDPGYERAVAAALASRAAAVLADDARSAFALAEEARTGGLGPLTVLVPARGAHGDGAPPSTGEALGDHVRPLPGGEPVASLLRAVRRALEGAA